MLSWLLNPFLKKDHPIVRRLSLAGFKPAGLSDRSRYIRVIGGYRLVGVFSTRIKDHQGLKLWLRIYYCHVPGLEKNLNQELYRLYWSFGDNTQVDGLFKTTWTSRPAFELPQFDKHLALTPTIIKAVILMRTLMLKSQNKAQCVNTSHIVMQPPTTQELHRKQ